jgi:hypothetical protein
MFLANSDYRKEYGNIGPVLTWLNLESEEEVDNLYQLWSANKAKLMSAPESKPWGLHLPRQRADLGMELVYEVPKRRRSR